MPLFGFLQPSKKTKGRKPPPLFNLDELDTMLLIPSRIHKDTIIDSCVRYELEDDIAHVVYIKVTVKGVSEETLTVTVPDRMGIQLIFKQGFFTEMWTFGRTINSRLSPAERDKRGIDMFIARVRDLVEDTN